MPPLSEFIVSSVLKKDAFSEVQSGYLEGDAETLLIRRRMDCLPWLSRPIGRYLALREARALAELHDIKGVPDLVYSDRNILLRGWIDGSPLSQVGEIDQRWSASAHRILRQMHRRGVTHNDLAKPQNWLVTPDGGAALIDFQLATVHRKRGRLFRTAKYEDLRHLLKQKRRYGKGLLTPTAHRLLARRSLPSHLWRRTAKPLYNFVTRRVMHWSDNEGLGKDLPDRIETVQAALEAAPNVRAAVVLPCPRPGGTALYAFVEGGAPDTPLPGGAPELLQTVDALPRSETGHVRIDLLALVAENRIHELGAHLVDHPDLADVMQPIVRGRLNLSDRLIS